MEEILVPDDAELVGKELMHTGIRSEYNLMVVAIKRRDGTMVFNPSPHELFEAGDILVAIGPQENLLNFERDIKGSFQA
jgi:voltage-gated potassium channel